MALMPDGIIENINEMTFSYDVISIHDKLAFTSVTFILALCFVVCMANFFMEYKRFPEYVASICLT